MARKHHPNPLEDPPAASSSEEEVEEEEEAEEEEEVEEEEEEEEVEEEEDQPNSKPVGSDSEDGEEEEDDDNEDEEGKEELKTNIHPQPTPKSVSKNPNPNPQDDEDDDEDDETESDSDPRSPGISGYTIKKHASTAVTDTPNTNASLKPKKPAAKTGTVVISLKRPAEGDLEKDSKSKVKKTKTENGGEEGTAEKKFSIHRLWSEEDEIVVLKGMIEFHEKHEVDPNSDSVAFHEFVKGNLSVDVSKSQLMDKIRRLKKKYKNNATKGVKGEDPVFSRPHDHISFELSKKIWGGVGLQSKKSAKKKNPASENPKPKPMPNTEIVIAKVAKDNGNAHPKDVSMVDVTDTKEQGRPQGGNFSQLYPFLNLSLKSSNFPADLMSKNGAEAMEGCLRCLDTSELAELDEEWRKQILDEAEVCTRRSVLLQKQVKLVSNWHARSG